MTGEVRLTNGIVDVGLSVADGMRVSRYGFAGGENMFASAGARFVDTPLGVWRPLGGHRLWVAPETMPGSYAPDALPVTCDVAGPLAAQLAQPVDAAGIEKRMYVVLSARDSIVRVTHTVVNRTCWPIRVAPWPITIVRADGTAILPQPPFRSHADDFLPARPLAQWAFTDFADPRWSIDASLIRLTPDATRAAPQKIGVGNTAGWCALRSAGCLFVKRFSWTATAPYPDFGCNNEVFTAAGYLELETLGPLELLDSGRAAHHTECWALFPDQPESSSSELAGRLHMLAASIDPMD